MKYISVKITVSFREIEMYTEKRGQSIVVGICGSETSFEKEI